MKPDATREASINTLSSYRDMPLSRFCRYSELLSNIFLKCFRAPCLRCSCICCGNLLWYHSDGQYPIVPRSNVTRKLDFHWHSSPFHCVIQLLQVFQEPFASSIKKTLTHGYMLEEVVCLCMPKAKAAFQLVPTTATGSWVMTTSNIGPYVFHELGLLRVFSLVADRNSNSVYRELRGCIFDAQSTFDL